MLGYLIMSVNLTFVFKKMRSSLLSDPLWISWASSSQVCHFGLAVFHQGQSNKALELPQT